MLPSTKLNDQLYAPKHVRMLLNISTVNYSSWVARGFLRPSHPANTRGSGAKFTWDDLIKGCVFTDLSEAGFTNKLACTIAYDEWLDEVITENKISEITIDVSECAGVYIDLARIISAMVARLAVDSI